MHRPVPVHQPLPKGQEAVLLALPGSGCSPSIYSQVRIPGWVVQPVDWACAPGRVDPVSIARQLADALNDRDGPTAVAGHSTGGAIAALVASMVPDRVEALVVSNTGVHSRGHGDPCLPDRIRNCWTKDMQQAFLRACFDKAPPPALWRGLCTYLAELPVDKLLQAVEGLRALDLTDCLGKIACRTLIAHGRHDPRRSVEDARALVRAIPRASLALLPGGHTPMTDCTADYSDAVARFLAPEATT